MQNFHNIHWDNMNLNSQLNFIIPSEICYIFIHFDSDAKLDS